MSDYRDKAGRYRERNGLDILEEYGACVMIGALVLAPLWCKPFIRFCQEVLG